MISLRRRYGPFRRSLLPQLVIAALVATSAAHGAEPPKAVVKPENVAAASELERLTDLDANRAAPPNAAWFEVASGDAPVIVSAPHATQVFRENAWRFADGGGTAALAMQLHDLNHVTVIHTVFRAPSDPNYYDDNDYKRTLGTLLQQSHPKLVLDIHGSDPRRPYDVDIGTLNGKSLFGHPALEKALIHALRMHGIEAISSNFFAASKNHTVTRYCAEHGIPAMQLEINANWLDPAGGDLAAHRFAALLDALTEFLRTEPLINAH